MGTSVNLDRDFLRRVRRSTLIVGVVLALGAFVLGGNKAGFAWLAGVGLSVINLLAIEWILVRILKPSPNVGLKLGAVLLAKVPLVFLLIYVCVGPLGLPVDWFAYGFALIFAVFLLKALAIVMLSAMGIQVSSSPRAKRALVRRGVNDGSSSDADRGRRARTAGTITLFILFFSPLFPRLVSHQDGWVTSVKEQPSVALAQQEKAEGEYSGQNSGSSTDDAPAHAADSHGGATPARESDADPHRGATPAGETDAGLHGDIAQGEEEHGDDAAHGEAGHGTDAHGEAAHGEEDHGPVKHFPNLITYLTAILTAIGVDPAVSDFLTKWENIIFAMLAAAILGGAAFSASRSAQMIPGRLQNLVEYAVEGYYNFVRGILGDETRRYIPFVGTLFFYIWTMNWMGLIPGGKSPTSYLNTTAALAICVFVFVQFTGITRLGPKKFLMHLAGDPTDALGWALVPLMFPLHVIGELAKPLSLSLRLFGNIMGEDTLLALFAMLVVIPIPHLHVGVPFHLPFMFLALLASTIQALVFSLLAAIYLSQVLPHGHEHESEHAHGHQVAHAH